MESEKISGWMESLQNVNVDVTADFVNIASENNPLKTSTVI